MAIPKMKIYRLDQNYSPDNDTDLKSINDDEAYPFVEKSLDLNSFEQLVGVTYRDLMVGRSQNENESGGKYTWEFEMFSEAGGDSRDKKKTEFAVCDGWKKGRNAVKVRIALDKDADFSEVLADSYYRINYGFADSLYNSSGDETRNVDDAVSKRRSELIQIEFGNVIYSDGVYLKSGEEIKKVQVEYSTFSTDISAGGTLSLGCGDIYDGTVSGRLGLLAGNGYNYKPDSNGFPLKAEGNIGYKMKVYPCRQLVALQAGADSLWNADLQISPTGSITIGNCQHWILTPTDERRPRVFERVIFNGKTVFRELELNTQYTLTNIPAENGRIDIAIQLSTEYYNIAYGVYVFPRELFVRYNEEIDLVEDVFVPDYLNYDSDGNRMGDEGVLTTSLLSYDSVKRQMFRMALTESAGYENGRDLLLSGTEASRTINLESCYSDGVASTLKLYFQGALFYSAGSTMVDSPFNVSVSGSTVTITPKDSEPLPTGFLVSYMETHKLGMGRDSDGNNYWACGYRICCYEKTKTAKEFVSSFRNWVSDHLNNNPDVFYGWQDYEGSTQNEMSISYLQSGFSILYREGAVVFPEEIIQNSFQDIRNWPPAGAAVTVGTSAAALKKYLQQIYAKFAYYDGIFDITNGLLREFESGSGNYRYMLIDDPTYPGAENKRWLIRNDNKMPTTFFHNNAYLPTPNYVETGNCEMWLPIGMREGENLMMNLSDHRSILIREELASPPVSEGNGGDVAEKSFTLVWNPAYIGETGKVTAFTSGTAFTVSVQYTKGDSGWTGSIGKLKLDGDELLEQIQLYREEDYDFDKSISENIASRPRHIFATEEAIPYDVVFEAGESGLLIYTKRK